MSQFNANRCNTPYRLEGFVRSGFESIDQVPAALLLGEMDELSDLISRFAIEELFLALDNDQTKVRRTVLDRLYPYRLPIKSLASREEIVSGKVPLFSLFGIPLVPLTPVPMPAWQQQLKWISDKLMAFIGLLLFSPLFVLLAIRVKAESPGPVIFKQERVGKLGKPFTMYKFRTMYEEAEANGPQLSSLEDSRITPFGRFMRKYRLDELPQFINVLKGNMSLVGPRPERPCYVEQILKRAPHYYLVQQVLPGITSWGMVKYGYANSVDQMIQRLEFDMLYLENQSLLIDLKILLFTIKPLISGKGM
jgi:exopolysaccharide biosynthesis polyprenyl glycosylphosphotransferase